MLDDHWSSGGMLLDGTIAEARRNGLDRVLAELPEHGDEAGVECAKRRGADHLEARALAGCPTRLTDPSA